MTHFMTAAGFSSYNICKMLFRPFKKDLFALEACFMFTEYIALLCLHMNFSKNSDKETINSVSRVYNFHRN